MQIDVGINTGICVCPITSSVCVKPIISNKLTEWFGGKSNIQPIFPNVPQQIKAAKTQWRYKFLLRHTVTGQLNMLGEDAKTLLYTVHELTDNHNWPVAL